MSDVQRTFSANIVCAERIGGPEYSYERAYGKDLPSFYTELQAAVTRTFEQQRGIKRIDVTEDRVSKYFSEDVRARYEVAVETVLDKADIVKYQHLIDWTDRDAYAQSYRADVHYLSDEEQWHDPMGDHYGISATGMIAEQRKMNGTCVECGRAKRSSYTYEDDECCIICAERITRQRLREAVEQARQDAQPNQPWEAEFAEVVTASARAQGREFLQGIIDDDLIEEELDSYFDEV